MYIIIIDMTKTNNTVLNITDDDENIKIFNRFIDAKLCVMDHPLCQKFPCIIFNLKTLEMTYINLQKNKEEFIPKKYNLIDYGSCGLKDRRCIDIIENNKNKKYNFIDSFLRTSDIKKYILNLPRYDCDIEVDSIEPIMEKNNAGNYIKFNDLMKLFKE